MRSLQALQGPRSFLFSIGEDDGQASFRTVFLRVLEYRSLQARRFNITITSSSPQLGCDEVTLNEVPVR